MTIVLTVLFALTFSLVPQQDEVKFQTFTKVDKRENKQTSITFLRIYGSGIPYAKGIDIDLGENAIDIESKELPFVVELDQLSKIGWLKYQRNDLVSIRRDFVKGAQSIAYEFVAKNRVPFSNDTVAQLRSAISPLVEKARKSSFEILLPHQAKQLSELEFAKRLDHSIVWALRSFGESVGLSIDEDVLKAIAVEEATYKKEVEALDGALRVELDKIKAKYRTAFLKSLNPNQRSAVEVLLEDQ